PAAPQAHLVRKELLSYCLTTQHDASNLRGEWRSLICVCFLHPRPSAAKEARSTCRVKILGALASHARILTRRRHASASMDPRTEALFLLGCVLSTTSASATEPAKQY